jgi:hypothetical protein
MKKLFVFMSWVVVVLSASMVSNLQPSAGRVVLGSLVIGGGLTALGRAEDSQFLDRLSYKCNMSKEDLHAALATSIMLYGIGCLPIGDELGLPLRQFAFRAPFVAALVGMVSSQAVKKIISQVPGIGVYFGACSEEYCEGACNQCKVRTTMIALTLWKYMVAPKIEAVENSRMGSWLGLS